MKALILSCDTGEGHNSAGKAILSYMKEAGAECEMIDTLSLISPVVSQAVSDIYVFSTRTNLFKVSYKAGEVVSSGTSIKSVVYHANRLYCKRLYDYINSNGFDTVICTHLFPAEAITALRHSKGMSQKTIFIATDYTCFPFMKETDLDCYVIPHEHLIEEYVEKGIPRWKLYPFGIPVRDAFHSKLSKDSARLQCIHEFGKCNPDSNWFLIMSGSMGFGNSSGILDKLDEELPGQEIFVVCGNNAKIREELAGKAGKTPGVHILGFTDKIPLLMDACDVIFTKPGGLSSTEAAAKGIPIIHTSPIPGCETRNAEFFHYHNMSYSTTDTSQQVRTAVRLCKDPVYRSRMILSQKANISPDTCRHIYQLCCNQ